MGLRPSSHLDISRVIGEEAMLKLCAEYGGESVYIPKLSSILDIKSETILREYNGSNARSLAKRFDITERRVYQIVQGVGIRPAEGQITLEDTLREQTDAT